jgi:hypothetical protein
MSGARGEEQVEGEEGGEEEGEEALVDKSNGG